MNKFVTLSFVFAALVALYLVAYQPKDISLFQRQATGEAAPATAAGNWWDQPLNQEGAAAEAGEIVEATEYEPGQGPTSGEGSWTFGTWGVGGTQWSWSAPDVVSQVILSYDLTKAEEQVKVTRMTERLFSNSFQFRRTAQYSFKHKSHFQDKWQLNNTNDIGHITFPPSFTIDRPEVTERGTLALSNETFKEFKFNTPRSYFKTYSYSTDVTVDAFSCSKATISANLRSFRVPFNLTIHLVNSTDIRTAVGIYLLKTASDLDIQQVPTPCPNREAAPEYEPGYGY